MNKKTLLSLAISTILSISTAATALADERRGNNNRGGYGDIEQKVERLFNILDTDENNSISLDELLSKKLEKAANKFDRLDTDDNELISLEGLLAAHNGRNNDDIDREALRACIEAEPGIELPEFVTLEERFDLADSNDDGFIDRDEFATAKTSNTTEKFLLIDTDNDEGISKEEMKVALEKLYALHNARRTCRQQQADLSDIIGE